MRSIYYPGVCTKPGTYYQGWFMYMRYTQGQNEEYLHYPGVCIYSILIQVLSIQVYVRNNLSTYSTDREYLLTKFDRTSRIFHCLNRSTCWNVKLYSLNNWNIPSSVCAVGKGPLYMFMLDCAHTETIVNAYSHTGPIVRDMLTVLGYGPCVCSASLFQALMVS